MIAQYLHNTRVNCILDATFYNQKSREYVKTRLNLRNDQYKIIECKVPKLKHHLYSSVEKSWLIERMMQYFKDRTTECFDDSYPCNNYKQTCIIQYVYNWIRSFVYLYNTKIRNTILLDIGGEIVSSQHSQQ